MAKNYFLILILTTLSFSKERIAISTLLGGIDWKGMTLDNQYNSVGGFSLGLDLQYEYNPYLHVTYGTLIGDQWSLFSPGYTPDNTIWLNTIESGTQIRYWKFEVDAGLLAGLAYKTGPSKRIQVENEQDKTNERCLITCFNEDVATETKTLLDPIYGFYWNILVNINDISLGWKFRKFNDRNKWFLSPSFYLKFQFDL